MTSRTTSNIRGGFSGKVREVFGADLRSLAALRIALAVIVLVDIAMRLQDFTAFYTDDGVLPRNFLLETLITDSMFSLHFIGGGAVFQGMMFFLLAVAAISMLVGYRTRLSTIIVWILLLSLARRNPLILNGGDTLLRMLLFWAMFLPLGAFWSVDRFLKDARDETRQRLHTHFVSVATAALFLQIAFMYTFTAILKSGDEWRVDGTAIYYALNYEQLAKPLGSFLLQFPELLKMMTFGTLWLEVLGPVLLFIPFFTGISRVLMVFAFAGLHMGIWSTMEIGLFPWVSAACMVCFLPGWFWEHTAAFLNRRLPRLTQAFSGGLSSLLGWSRPFLERPVATVGEAARNFGRSVSPSPSSFGFAASGSGGGRSATAERPKPGKSDKSDKSGKRRSRNETPFVLSSSRPANILCGVFLVYVFLWNLTSVTDFEMPDSAKTPGITLGLSQNWSMFAPHPPRGDVGWFVLPGELRDGSEFDMMSVVNKEPEPKEATTEKPEVVSGAYENKHWRKYLTTLLNEDQEDRRMYFGRYVCRSWNSTHTTQQQLVSFDMVYLREEASESGSGKATKANVMWNDFDCF